MAIDLDILDAEKLKRKAVEELKVRPPVSHIKFSEMEMIKTIHELEVRTIGLTILREELERANQYIEDLTRKYNELLELHNSLIRQKISEQSR